MSTSREELLACPFCGPGNSIVECYQDDIGYWKVGCGACGSHSGIRPKSDPEGRAKVIASWNRTPDRLAATPKAGVDREVIARIISEQCLGHDFSSLYADKRDWMDDRGSRHDVNVPYKGDVLEAADDLRVRESVAREKLRSERQRQIDVEGWSPAHDDAHENAELMRAGMCYLAEAASTNSHQPHGTPMTWPWEDKWWKPSTPERNLIKAGGLFFAEKERLERANRYSGHVTHKIELVIRRLAALASPSLTAGWQPIETAPKDGTRILIWFVHASAKYSENPVVEGWEAAHEAYWIDHNGGGWTWHGLCGVATYWQPLPSAPATLIEQSGAALDLQGPGKMDSEDRSTHEA